MPFVETNGLIYYKFDIFPEYLVHGIFTRQGGVSPKPWNTLNLGGTVGDQRDNVVENRRRIFSSIDRPVDSIFDVWQVHSDKIVCAEVPRALDALHQKADGILSNSTQLTLLMRFADCVPIFLFDPVRKVMGLVHAGWQGTIKKICTRAVQMMCKKFGSEPKDILAGIGPSICADHYEVGEDVCTKVREVYSGEYDKVIIMIDGRSHFNLWKANRLELEKSGLRSIQVSEECTSCHLDRWFSHRGEKGLTGRFGAVMYLR